MFDHILGNISTFILLALTGTFEPVSLQSTEP